MNSDYIKDLINEVKSSGVPATERATLMAQFLQAYHLAQISEKLDAVLYPIRNTSNGNTI